MPLKPWLLHRPPPPSLSLLVTTSFLSVWIPEIPIGERQGTLGRREGNTTTEAQTRVIQPQARKNTNSRQELEIQPQARKSTNSRQELEIQPQARKNTNSRQELERARNWVSSEASRKSATLLSPWFWPSDNGSQPLTSTTVREGISVVSRPQVCGNFLQQT